MNSTRPQITVSSLDLQRLEAVLESLPRAAAPYADALEEELARATVLEPNAMPADVATMNSTVRFIDRTTQQEQEVTLVYPHEADGRPGTVSVLAPVGSALLGLRIGERIQWQVPGGHRIDLELAAVTFQPEAAGQYHR